MAKKPEPKKKEPAPKKLEPTLRERKQLEVAKLEEGIHMLALVNYPDPHFQTQLTELLSELGWKLEVWKEDAEL